MYKIEGDGSYENTKVSKDGEIVPYESLVFRVSQTEGCIAWIDTNPIKVDYMLLSGVYMIISGGLFNNTRVIFMDNALRGVQYIEGNISKGKHPKLTIDAILLPNIVENP